MILGLIGDLDHVSDLLSEPPLSNEVSETDVVVGVMTPRQRAIFTVLDRQMTLHNAKLDEFTARKNQYQNYALEDLPSEIDEKGRSLKAELQASKAQHTLIEDLYRHEMAEEFKTPAGHVLEVRKGWQVVAVPQRSITDLLGEITSTIESLMEGDGCGNPDCPIHGTAAKAAREDAKVKV